MGPDLHQQSALELLDEPAHANETTTANEGSLSANLHRMLSRSIWKRKRWDFKARRKYFSVFWVVVVIVCSIFVGTGITVTVKVDTAKPLFVVAIDGRPPREGLFMFGGIRKWDMENKMLCSFASAGLSGASMLNHPVAAVRWVPHQCGDAFDAPLPGNCIRLMRDAFFYTGSDALGLEGFNLSTAILNFSVLTAGYRAKGFEQTLDMDIPVYTRSGHLNNNGRESDALYPFDWYAIDFLIAAVSSNTTIPMAGASLFNPSQTHWLARTTYDYLDLPDQAAKLYVHIEIERHVIVKISAILILISNWLVTLVLLYMTIFHVLGCRQLPIGIDSVSVVFAGLFALPSVRSVLPGNPPFGCLIDFIGILPNIAIISGCAVWLLVTRLHAGTDIAPPCHDRSKDV